jgi:hypothetical protein
MLSAIRFFSCQFIAFSKYRKYKWGVESSWSSRKWSWRHEIMDASSESACG